MPGRLIKMDQPGATLSQDPRKDRSQAQPGNNTSQSQDFALKQAGLPTTPSSFTHGANGALPNGTVGLDRTTSTMNGGPGDTSPTILAPNSPPALDQSWRDSHGNKSMGVLLERLAQRCFSDLNETLTKMSDLPTPPQAAQPNGITPHIVDTSAASLGRKRMFMEFAHNQRDRFIKTLVLADWSRNEQEMAKLIDLRVWQDKQRNAQSNAISFIATVKHNLLTAKMPNPNVEGALELLATGKASHVPDLGYLPLKRLTAKQLLRTLQNMNVTLATRLNLHEELPSYFNDYTIINGRATFRVAGEFEVDLSVADEDPASPFYFIDIRFLFSPSSLLLNEQLRAALETRCNQAMASKGLCGCYDFLHNFVLTHKINILHSQANELQRGKWFDCLRVDAPRRVLVLQYWSGRPGPKSWLQFGIMTGKQNRTPSRKPFTPHLTVRWFRRGVEIKDDIIEVDWQNLNIETIVSTAIAKHVAWSLRNIQSRMETLAGNNASLQCTLSPSSQIPEDCNLTLALPSMCTPFIVKFEPVTGQISLSPPTPATINIESRLNRDPNVDVASTLAHLLCSTVQERVGKTAELLGWSPAGDLARQDNLADLFGKDAWSRSIYTCNKGWGSEWALVATFSLKGEKWWVVRLEQVSGSKTVPNGRIISTVRHIPVADAIATPSLLSRHSLLQIEELAETEVSLTALSKQLATMHVPHRFERLVPLAQDSRSDIRGISSSVAMYIKTSALLGKSSRPKERSWATDFVRVTHDTVEAAESVNDGSVELRHDIGLTVKPGQLQHLQEHLIDGRASDIAMNASGAVTLRLRTPFGQPFAEPIRARLCSIERLDHYLAVLKAHKFRCISAGLSKLVFRYNESPALAAQLHFSKDGGLPARLKLEPLGSNPHQRIRAMLERYINTHNKDFFTIMTTTLQMTLPLLLSLERIEVADTGTRSIFVHARQPLWFNLTYKTPFPPCRFEIRCRNRSFNGKAMLVWHISRLDRPGLSALPEGLVGAITQLYKREGQDWWGTGNGILARSTAISSALEQLDETVRKFKGAEVTSSDDEDLDSKPLIQQSSLKNNPAKRPQPQSQQQQQRRPSSQQQKARPAPPNAHPVSFSHQNRPTAAGNPVKKEIIELD